MMEKRPLRGREVFDMEEYRNLFSLVGKTALVAGGAGGLGMAIAEAYLQNGANLIVAARLEDEAKALGLGYLAVPVDILDTEAIDKMVDAAMEKFGRIDILMNAAGLNVLKKAEEYDEETWDKVMDSNVKGVHLVTKAVGRVMIRQRYGRIVSISSVRGTLGMPQDYLAYCTSKGALNMYTKQLACEWAKYNITCNAIAPTFTRTAINAFQLDDPEFYARLIARIPLGRICTTRDLAAAAVYLSSDAAAFVTGQILGVDGGITLIQ